MTEITYENGVVVVSQYGVSTIRFRPRDLDYDSRMAMWKAGKELVTSKEAGEAGYLRTQPVEVRQAALEEALGVSFPCGTGEEYDNE